LYLKITMTIQINIIAGILCIILGFLTSVAGIGGGIATMIKEIKSSSIEQQADDANWLAQLIEALTAFLKALNASPTWLSISILGLLIFSGGFYLTNTNMIICK
jgi:uncharacterized membrane protein